MKDFGTVVTLEIAGGAARAARFAEALQYFSIAASVGSTESLVMPPQLLGGGEFNPEQRAASLLRPGTVRLSIGLEDASDLIDDLSQALEHSGSQEPESK
jgi:cystathionine beta-lyase/cystathionine gamma-synthase